MISKLKFNNKKTLFRYEANILASHLNYGNHLGYDAVLSLLQDARMLWLKEHNMSELSIYQNTGWMVSEVNVSYKSEGNFSDELKIELYTTNTSARTLTIVYCIYNKTTGKVLAVATTKHFFYDFSLCKLSTLPNNFEILINRDNQTL